jgi:hypothetical protein
MNREKLKIAVEECERFLKRVCELPNPEPYTEEHMQGFMHDNFPKEQGAIKRASMDLSRALTELRNK